MDSKPKHPKPPSGAKNLGGEDWVIEFNQPAAEGDTQVFGATVMSESMIRAAKSADHGATVSLDLQDLMEVADVAPAQQGGRIRRSTKPMAGRPKTTKPYGTQQAGAPAPQTTGTLQGQGAAEVVEGAFGVSQKLEDFQMTPGTMVHKYELIRKLGRGGMGTVWAAHDTSLGRKVAIKFLHTKASKKKEFRERFLAEARATAQFNHENIVTIHDAGEFSGSSYLVLEYLEGEPLSNRLKSRKLPHNQAVQLMTPVVRALVEAHGVGIIHRDLKPDNIFILNSGGVKVLDFGLAKLFDTEASIDLDGENKAELMAKFKEAGAEALGDSSVTGGGSGVSSLTGSRRSKLHDSEGDLTRAGTIMGTYAYMSPEQWGLGRVDAASDIWAAGVILFQMITGEHPFGSKATETIMANIGKLDEPVRSVREVVPTVPEEVAQIVSRCLQKRKKGRYKTAKELLEALESVGAAAAGRIALREDQSPYPGLSAFTEQDANRFFGRDSEIAQFIGKLKQRPMLAVIGPSGAGKSSFIRAGVIPTLRTGTDWDVIYMRPGRDPFAGLTNALLLGMSSHVSNVQSVDEAAQEEKKMAAELKAEPGKLGAMLRHRARQHGRPVILYVDQFEELYTLVEDADERDRFATCLAGAAVDAATPIRVTLSMRSDFLDRVAENQNLMNAITRDLTILQQPGLDGLREAVIKPAALAGFTFEDVSIVDAMVNSLAEETAALPLLQFAAQKLWEARDRKSKLLTRAAYTNMGGVEGALVRHADSVIKAMSTGDRKATRRLFQRLVTPEGTRAVLSLGEIMGLFENPKEAQRILNVLTEARLLVIQSFGEEAVDARVEIVHESLINRWQTLRRWLDESHEDSAMLAQLRDAARQWEARGRPVGLLWTGDAVDEARRWRRRSNAVLTPLEDAFLTAAFRHADRAVRRKRLLLTIAVSAMALVTVGALIALLMIRDAERKAKVQARRATAEAKRASAAESRVRKQMKLLAAETERAKKAEELASNRLKEVQKTRAREQKAQQALQKSYQELQSALARAKRERQRAQRASRRARLFAARAQRSAKNERISRLEAERAKRMLERLLERERQEVSRLKALRSKVIQKLPQ